MDPIQRERGIISILHMINPPFPIHAYAMIVN